MRRDERIVSASKLRFPVSSGIIMNHILLGRAIDHSLRLFHCRRFAFSGVGGHKLLYRRLHLRFGRPVSSIALDCLPHSFLCV